DLETGALKYALQDPDVPQTNEEVVAGNQGSDFGFSFVIMDDLLIIGQPNLSVPGKDKVGGLQIHDIDTGELLARYANGTGEAGENFGYALVADGDRLAIVSTPEVSTFREITRIDMFRVAR
ncbi:MAG: hypothetical protein AAGJ28_26155, partial [Pseudomonadota bacterium]